MSCDKNRTDISTIFIGDFDDANEYKKSTKCWEGTICQLKKGAATSRLHLISADNFVYLKSFHSNQSEDFALAVKDGLSFKLFDEASLPCYLMGKKTPGPTLCCTPKDGIIHSVTPDNHESYCVNLSSDLIEQIIQRHNIFSPSVLIPPRTKLFSIKKSTSKELTYWFDAIYRLGESNMISQELLIAIVNDIIENIIGPLLIKIILGQEKHENNRNIGRDIKHIESILTIVNSSIESTPTIAQLAQKIGVSQRAIQYLFKRHMKMSPKQYIKAKRLNAVRSCLKQAKSQRGIIAEIANRHGFWHMGQFAQDYRVHFGVSPKHHLRK